MNDKRRRHKAWVIGQKKIATVKFPLENINFTNLQRKMGKIINQHKP